MTKRTLYSAITITAIVLVIVMFHMQYSARQTAGNLNEIINSYKHGYRSGARNALYYENKRAVEMPEMLKDIFDDYDKVKWYMDGDTLYLEKIVNVGWSARYLKVGDTMLLDSIWHNDPDSNVVMIRYSK